MRCLYETLGIEATADDATIRVAFRREALKNHPDKNPGDVSAEERFKEIQNAYEILSDKNERAWYDSHRDAILRSGQRHQSGASVGESHPAKPDNWVDIYAYHTSACYSGFNDGPRGFYTVYDALFETLANQELSAASVRAEKKGCSSAQRLPRFGNSATSGKEVLKFYSVWSSFVSSRDFNWADEYNLASAPNRKVRRAMQNENEKIRRAARREYNESVRGLVEFLRKRDKRLAAYQIEQARKRQEREAFEAERRERERKARMERAKAYKAAEWALTDSSDSEDSTEAELPQSLFHCPACDKYFKSEAAYANHERSKKHKELLELLILELQAEEDQVILQNEDSNVRDIDESKSDATHQCDHGIAVEKIQDENKNDASVQYDSDIELNCLSSEEGSSKTNTQAKSHCSSASFNSSQEEESDECKNITGNNSDYAFRESSDSESDLDEDAMLERLLQSHLNVRQNPDQSSSESEEDPVNENEQSQADIMKLGSSDDEFQTLKKKKKKKKSAQTQVHEVDIPKKRGSNHYKNQSSGTESISWRCNSCDSVFDSRNQLFKHIKLTGHARRIG